MGIEFTLEYGNNEDHTLYDESCFAKLKDIEEQAEWCDEMPIPHTVGGIAGVRYHARPECTSRNAELWYDYLKGTSIWGKNLRDKGLTAEGLLEHGVSVDTSLRPYHLLNTLSIYRHVEVFGEQVNLFGAYLKAGMVPDMAFITACLTDSHNGHVVSLANECPEHTVVAAKTFTDRDYIRYVAMAKGTKQAPTSRKDVTSNYRECLKYQAGGVATWLTYTDDRSKHKDKELFAKNMLPKDYRIRYDKEAKKVLDITPIDGKVLIDDLTVLVEARNALHYSLIVS